MSARAGRPLLGVVAALAAATGCASTEVHREGDYVVAHLKPYLGQVALRQWHTTPDAPSAGAVVPSASTVVFRGGGEFTLFGRETYYLVVHAAASSASGLTIEKVERARAADLESRLRPVGDAVSEPIRP